MTRLKDVDLATIKDLKNRIEHLLLICGSLEEAAQTFTNLLFEEFETSIALIRFFATFPFNVLPTPFHKAVTELADARGVTALLTDETPILTLLGTRGGENFRNARTYFGIPLASTEFVSSLPVVSQFLKDFGFELNWEKEQGSMIHAQHIETHTSGFLSGVFYVPDAQQARNTNGEPLLSVVDRIITYNLTNTTEIETIFGFGGAYINGPFIAIIVFSTEALDQHTVELFTPLANYFKTATLKLVLDGKFFA